MYTVQITLGGQNFTVQLDTGSSDLWLYTAGRPVQLTNSSDLIAVEAYGKGQVQGNIAFAQLQIGDFTIESQAFLNATDLQDFDLSSFDGIMGMAFDIASIYGTVQSAWGTDAANNLARSPITALFAQNPSLPNNFDVQLARSTELEDIAEGAFVISSHATGYENVTSAPKLPRVAPDHWSVVVDSMLVNNQTFPFNQSRIDGVPTGTIVAALDTGFSFPPLPPAAVDAIYGSIPGALYDELSQVWLVPCNGSTNLTFVFGGQQFPVHPLDLTFPVVVTLPVNGQDTNLTACINTYQYLTLDPNSFQGFDIVLGDAFLRNVYASFDYGDYDPTNNSTNGNPFVQMLPTTNATTMWNEFQTERAATLAQLPPAIDPALLVQYEAGSAPPSSSTGTTDGDALARLSGAVSTDGTSSSSDNDSWLNKNGTIVLGLLGANLLVGIVLLAVALTMCVRGMKGRNVGSRYTPVRFKDSVPADDFERGAMKYSD
ncbi:aspartic peptidase domain-containing protein [Ganoderma leucocontextum]|nr:aspartic peptidase domain-containing protein [Ganoderma leucocontextum]